MGRKIETEFDRRVAARHAERVTATELRLLCRPSDERIAELADLARKEVTAEMDAEFRAAIKPLLPLIECMNVGAMRAYVEAIARRHSITVIWQAPTGIKRLGARAFAEWGARRVRVPLIERGGDAFAVALHELGHVIAGPCPKVASHFADPDEQRWHHCLACEASAWRIALFDLAPESEISMTHKQLYRSLETYLQASTPGTARAFQEIDYLRSRIALLEAKHQRQVARLLCAS